jgi:hypothetical protein
MLDEQTATRSLASMLWMNKTPQDYGRSLDSRVATGDRPRKLLSQLWLACQTCQFHPRCWSM